MNEARRACGQHSSKRGVFRLCAEALFQPHMRRLAEPERTLLQQGTVVRAVRKNRGLAFHILSYHFLVKRGAGPLITDGYCVSPWYAQTFPRCHRWKVGVTRMVALI